MELKLTASVYSRAPAIIGALLLASVVALVLASSSMPSAMAYSGNATYNDYQPEQVNWEYTSRSCPSLTSEDYDMNYRSRHRWTEFCGNLGPYTGAYWCHKCLQVTNTATSDDISVTLRIIDICNNNNGLVLWMDKVAFDQIDTDGRGAALGGSGTAQIEVNYEITDCGDAV